MNFHSFEAISGFSTLSQTGANAFGTFCKYTAKAGQTISHELSTNPFAAIPAIALLNLGVYSAVNYGLKRWESAKYAPFNNDQPNTKEKILQGIAISGTIFISVAALNLGPVNSFIFPMSKLVSIAIAIAAVVYRYIAPKLSEVGTLLASYVPFQKKTV